MTSQLAVAALHNALALRGAVGTVVHSDRGSQGGFNRSSQHLDGGGAEVGDCGLEQDDEGCAGWTTPAVAC
jgi:hypothetical protein